MLLDIFFDKNFLSGSDLDATYSGEFGLVGHVIALFILLVGTIFYPILINRAKIAKSMAKIMLRIKICFKMYLRRPKPLVYKTSVSNHLIRI